MKFIKVQYINESKSSGARRMPGAWEFELDEKATGYSG